MVAIEMMSEKWLRTGSSLNKMPLQGFNLVPEQVTKLC